MIVPTGEPCNELSARNDDRFNHRSANAGIETLACVEAVAASIDAEGRIHCMSHNLGKGEVVLEFLIPIEPKRASFIEKATACFPGLE